VVLVRGRGRQPGPAEEAHLRVPRHIRQVSQQAQEEDPPESQRGWFFDKYKTHFPAVLRIRDVFPRIRIFSIPDPGSRVKKVPGSRIRIRIEFNYFKLTQKIVSKLKEIWMPRVVNHPIYLLISTEN
jgi:hypothetical protein